MSTDTLKHLRGLLERALANRGREGQGGAAQLVLEKPDDMISWLNELNSNWAVCRNTRSFLEGQPEEYWKKFDKAMSEAFQLQVALMKKKALASRVPEADVALHNAAPALSACAEALEDLLNNESCSCIKLGQHPCARCKIAIDEAQAALDQLRKVTL